MTGPIHANGDSLVARLEGWLSRLAVLAEYARGRMCLATVLFWAATSAGVIQLKSDFSTERYLPADHGARETYDGFRARYGDDQVLLVGIDTADPFSSESVTRLRALEEAVWDSVPFVDEVTSLLNARHTYGEHDRLVVGNFLEVDENRGASTAEIRERAVSNPLYRNRFISDDGRYEGLEVRLATHKESVDSGESTNLFADEELEPVSDEDTYRAVSVLRAVVESHSAPDFDLSIAGDAIIVHHMRVLTERDVSIYTLFSIAVTFVLLWLLYRRIRVVIVTVVCAVFSLSSTMGLMGWIGVPFSITMQTLPTFILAVVVCDAVHLYAAFHRAAEETRRYPTGSDEMPMVGAMRDAALPIVLTSLTTSFGLLAFSFVELQPISDLSEAGPLGVLLGCVYVLVLFPIALGRDSAAAESDREGSRIAWAAFGSSIPLRLGRFAIRHPRRTSAAWGAVILLSVFSLQWIRLSNDAMEWFFPEDAVRIELEKIESGFGGLQTAELILDSGSDGGLSSPSYVAALDRLANDLRAYDDGEVRVVNVSSIAEVVKESHRALHNNDSAFYEVPETREEIAQELVLFESAGPDQVSRLVDTAMRESRMTIRTNWTDGAHYAAFLAEVDESISQIESVSAATITGDMVLHSEAFDLVLESLVRSYLLALFMVGPVVVVFIGRLRLGIFAALSNTVPTALVLGLAVCLDIPMSMGTVVVGSLILGVSVDDTIHLFSRVRRYVDGGADLSAAVEHALASTGVALLATTFILAGSFLVYLFTSFQPMLQFGLLAASACCFAFLTDVVFVPAVLASFPRFFDRASAS